MGYSVSIEVTATCDGCDKEAEADYFELAVDGGPAYQIQPPDGWSGSEEGGLYCDECEGEQ